MYHAIVGRIARRNFERVNTHDYEAILDSCSDDIHHRFGGRHSLGGERHDRAALRAWFHRLGRLAPGLSLSVHEVWVKGWPWRTVVIVRWTGAETLPDGSPYRNRGVHVIEMRWGKVVSIDANEDSQTVAESMPIRAAAGRSEALAPAIES